MTEYIAASHRDMEIDQQLRDAQVANFEKIERSRRPQPDPPPSKPVVKVTTGKKASPAAKKPAANKPTAKKPPAKMPTAKTPPPPPQVVPGMSGDRPVAALLPPGARILSADEAQAVDHLLDWYVEVQKRASQ